MIFKNSVIDPLTYSILSNMFFLENEYFVKKISIGIADWKQ
jgi:hypothetical protein